MSMPKTYNQKSSVPAAGPNSGSINWAVTAGAVVLLILIVGFIAWKNIGPSIAPASNNAVATAQDNANNAILDQLATKCKGNFNVLSSDDQNQANQLTHNHGALAISVMYKGPK